MPTITNVTNTTPALPSNGMQTPPNTPEAPPFGKSLLAGGARDVNAPIQVLLAEPMGPVAGPLINSLSKEQAQVTSVPQVDPADLMSTVLDVMKGRSTDLLVVRGNCKVNQQFMEQLSEQERPSYVLRAGTGMDNLDTDYLASIGISSSNTPDVNTQSTAELTLALMLAAKRKVPLADSQVKAGVWNRSALTGSELGGKTLGIVGVGRIGSMVGNVAKALGMEVIGLASTRRVQTEAERPAYLDEFVNLDELCSRSDVLTVHVPLNDSTRNLIGNKQIEQLSGRDALLINAARGGVINESALLDALDAGQIGAAGLDVFVEDPAPLGSVSDRLAKHPRVIATPHLGGQTVEASKKMGQAVVEQAQKMYLQRTASENLNS